MWSDEELEVEDLPPFRRHPGPTFVVGEEQNARDIFSCFFTPDLIEVLATETNRYGCGSCGRIYSGIYSGKCWTFH